MVTTWLWTFAPTTFVFGLVSSLYITEYNRYIRYQFSNAVNLFDAISPLTDNFNLRQTSQQLLIYGKVDISALLL